MITVVATGNLFSPEDHSASVEGVSSHLSTTFSMPHVISVREAREDRQRSMSRMNENRNFDTGAVFDRDHSTQDGEPAVSTSSVYVLLKRRAACRSHGGKRGMKFHKSALCSYVGGDHQVVALSEAEEYDHSPCAQCH